MAERRDTRAGRRDLDIEVEKKIKALTDAQTAMLETLRVQGGQINDHLVECSSSYAELKRVVDSNYVELKQVVDVIAAWVLPKIESAKAWKEITDTVKKAVITNTMIAVIKWGAIITVISLFLGSNPAIKTLAKFFGVLP